MVSIQMALDCSSTLQNDRSADRPSRLATPLLDYGSVLHQHRVLEQVASCLGRFHLV